MFTLTTGELAAKLGATLEGAADRPLTGVAVIGAVVMAWTKAAKGSGVPGQSAARP